jgi:glycerol-3-phosphate acyltransferase PlsY
VRTALYLTVWPVLGFLVGSIPFGYLVARARGVDIRTVGSGNIGMTNVWRTLGWKPGATVLVLDILKGVLPVVLLGLCWPAMTPPLPGSWLQGLGMGTGLASVLGHTFTPWLGFKGGKGIATGGGVFIALMQVWALVPVAVFGLALLVTRMVSAASLLAAYSGLATTIAVPHLRWLTLLVAPLAVFVTWTHRENIGRIMNGTERKVGSGKDRA